MRWQPSAWTDTGMATSSRGAALSEMGIRSILILLRMVLVPQGLTTVTYSVKVSCVLLTVAQQDCGVGGSEQKSKSGLDASHISSSLIESISWLLLMDLVLYTWHNTLHSHLMLQIPCTYRGCTSTFKRRRGRTYHIRTVHVNSNARPIQGDGDSADHANGTGAITVCQRIEHPHLTGVYTHNI